MGRNLRDAHRAESGVSRRVGLLGRRRIGLSFSTVGDTGDQEPALWPALLFCRWLGAVAAAVSIAIAIAAPAARCAGESKLAPEIACTQVRSSIAKLAQAEREQGLALHLMANGKPTPMVATRFTELQASIADLRRVLRQVRDSAPTDDQYVSQCIELGFRSLSDAESLSSQIQDLVTSEGGPLAPPQFKSGEFRDQQKLPEPPLPGAPIRVE